MKLLRLQTHIIMSELRREEGNFLLPLVLQRIPVDFPLDSFARGHMSIEVSFTCSEQPEEVQRVFQDLSSLFSHSPRHTGVACQCA